MISAQLRSGSRESIKRLQMDLQEFARATGQLVETVVKEEACLTARMAIKFTPSMSINEKMRNHKGQMTKGSGSGGDGDERKSQVWGEDAVNLSVRAIVMQVDDSLLAATSDFSNVDNYIKWRANNGPGSVRSAWLQTIMQTGDFVEQYKRLKAIFQERNSLQRPLDTGGLESWHRKMKRQWTYKMRFRKGMYGWMNSTPDNMRFAEESTIQSYVSQAMRKVGWIKSGWVRCIKQIGPVKIRTTKYPMGKERVFGLNKLPKYITRHTHGLSNVQMRLPSGPASANSSNHYSISIVNMVGNAGNIAYRAKTVNEVLNARRIARGAKEAKYEEIFNGAAAKFNTGR